MRCQFCICCRLRHADCRAWGRKTLPSAAIGLTPCSRLRPRVGRVIGIASVCREISWPRMKALTDKLADVIKASVTNGGRVFLSIQQAYDQSTIESQRTVTSKQTDCRRGHPRAF